MWMLISLCWQCWTLDRSFSCFTSWQSFSADCSCSKRCEPIGVDLAPPSKGSGGLTWYHVALLLTTLSLLMGLKCQLADCWCLIPHTKPHRALAKWQSNLCTQSFPSLLPLNSRASVSINKAQLSVTKCLARRSRTSISSIRAGYIMCRWEIWSGVYV